MTRAAVSRLWDRVQSSYWFVPLAMSVAAFFLAQLMLWIDAKIPDTVLGTSRFVYSGSASEARSALLAMAGSILTTGGVVYSLLTVPLSVAVSQFGSRLLRFYLRDHTIQLVLGMFVGTFIYCLAVGLSIPPPETNPAVPQLATTAGLSLTILTFAMLVLLIHHIATSLEAPNVAAEASRELRDVIQTFSGRAMALPPRDGARAQEPVPSLTQDNSYAIHAQALGYIQGIDPDVILPVAAQNDLVIRLLRKPGQFVQPGELLALVYPPNNVSPRVAERIRASYELGNLRVPFQDIGYGVNQLVELGVRAMSPAINDPFTAMTCLEHIGAGLGLYVAHGYTSPNIYDAEHHLRLIVDPIGFPELLDAAFNLMRRSSREMPEVLLAMVKALATISDKCTLPEQRAALVRHVMLVDAESQASMAIGWDKERVHNACAELCACLTTVAQGRDGEQDGF